MAAERQGLVPQRATLSETLATSTDARMRALTASANANNDVPFLLSLLSSSDAAVLEASADALWKLAIGAPARAAVHKANGARPLVALLSHPEQRVVRVAAGACSILALEQAQRTTILAAGGAAAIAAVLADGSDRAAEQAARAAANLAADEPTRSSLVDQKTAEHLAALLARRTTPVGLREAACRAIGRGASSAATSATRGGDERAHALVGRRHAAPHD